ncbi:MAG: hypothetical protein EA341_12090 [Mongoliibacter sp.]|uniref:DUF5995 family protein n=1 Tax=Mongoliibacter sp. TaxID=2022438 RepID=UPI0012EFA392|nr:DUF5995 family protein [Mongoliibacter sp.]TVP47795.1 MAG: hypothetical protein EA341_12090 [Mongoliibacter sp.]
MKNIDDVIIELDRVVQECYKNNSRLGYFAILYRQVTIRVKDGILKGEFDDNPRMVTLDIIFAKRFIDAYDDYKIGKPVSSSWKISFDTALSSRHIVLQHLLLGINAHINLDLGIAAAETMDGKNLKDIRNDFDKINAILYELVNGVKNNIGKVSPLFRLLIRFAQGRDDLLVNFSIRTARDGAWKFAEEYFLSQDRPGSIHLRDQVIAGLGESLSHPGKRLSRILRLISFAEWRSVSRTMDQLDSITKAAH